MSNPFMARATPTTTIEEPREDLGFDPVLGGGVEARGPQLPPGNVPLYTSISYASAEATNENVDVWLFGVHGGAGSSTLRGLLKGVSVGECTEWPAPRDGVTQRVILVGRTNRAGLDAVSTRAKEWASGRLDESISLLGTVLVADGPTPAKALHKDIRRVASLTPRTWHIGWQETWRALLPGEDRPVSTRVKVTIARLRTLSSPRRAGKKRPSAR